MSAQVQCPNGHRLAAKPEQNGKRVRCPTCKVIFEIRVESVLAGSPPLSASAAPSLPDQSVKADQDISRKRSDDEEDEDRPRKSRRDEEDDDDRPRKSRRDEEDEDRPRKSRRDEEDDDDRPRKRRRDEEFEDDDRPRKRQRDEEFEDSSSKRRRRDEDDDDDRPRKRRGRDDDYDDEPPEEKPESAKELKKKLRSVRAGLACYQWKYLLAAVFCGFNAFTGLIGVLAIATETRAIDQFAGILLLILMFLLGPLISLSVLILGIVGSCLTMAMPRKSGYRGLAITNLIFEPLPYVLMIAAMFMAFFSPARAFDGGGFLAVLGSMMLMILTAVLTFIASFIIFMLLVRGVALTVKFKSGASSILIAMIVCLAVPIFLIGLTFVVGMLVASKGIYVVILTQGAMWAIFQLAICVLGIRVAILISAVRSRIK